MRKSAKKPQRLVDVLLPSPTEIPLSIHHFITPRKIDCYGCGGTGLVDCRVCQRERLHSHVCLVCRGNGKLAQFMAAETLPGSY